MPEYVDAQAQEVPETQKQLKARVQAGEGKAALARELGISRDTLYQYLAG
ncbi:helix-turn-helix domain-containing protein [Deinococcus alpinitundrae]